MSTLGCVSVDTCFSFCFCGHSTLTTFSLSLLMIAVVAPPPRTDVISCAALLWSPQLLAIPPSSGDWSIFVGHDECIGGAAAQSLAATVRGVGKGSQGGPKPLQIFRVTKTRTFSTTTKSRSVTVVLDSVLGLDLCAWWCPCFFADPETTYAPMLKVFDGNQVSSKSPSRHPDRD